MANEDTTIKNIIDNMSDEQKKNVLYYLVGRTALSEDETGLSPTNPTMETLDIGDNLNKISGARLGSQVRSAIVSALKKIADLYETVINDYITAAGEYGSFTTTVSEARSTLKKFNTINTNVVFVDKNGNEIASTNQLASQGDVQYSTSGEGDNASSTFTFKIPFGKGDTGAKGADGTSTFIKFSTNETNPLNTGGGMTSTPNDKSYWLGIAQTTSKNPPENKTNYTWVRIKGETGAPGKDGKDGKDSDGLISQRLKATKVWWLASNNANLAKNGFVEESSYVSRNADLVKNSDLAAVVFQKSSYGSYVDKKGDHTILDLSNTTKVFYEGKNNTDYDAKVVVLIRKGETVTASITDRKGNRFSREVSWLTSALRRVDNASKTWTFQNAFYFSNAWKGPSDEKNGNKDVYTCKATDITKNRNTNKNWNQFMIPIAIYVFEGSNETLVDSDT